MAALENVQKVLSSITVDGVVYVLATDDAVAGDIIRFDDSSSYVTSGGYYKVTRIDSSDDPQITDNDDDEYDLCGKDFTVFKQSTTSTSPTTAKRLTVGDYAKIVANTEDHDYPIGSVVKIVTDDHDSKPYIGEYKDGSTGNYFMPADAVMATKAEFDGIKPANSQQYVHDGVVYFQMKRRAVVGEKVLIVKSASPMSYSDGYVGNVVRLQPSGHPCITDQHGKRTGIGALSMLYDDEYVVLVPATTATTSSVETRVHDGITYHVVNRNVRPGDKLVVITKISNWKTVGRVYNIVRIDSDGEPVVIDNDGDDTYVPNGNYAVLEPVETVQPTQYREVSRNAKTGETVKIVDAYDNEPYDNGDTAIATNGTDIDGDGTFDFNGESHYVCKREYVVLEPLESTQPVEPVTPVKTVVGDQIRITCYECGAPVGTIVTVSAVGVNDVRYEYETASSGMGFLASHEAYEIVGKPAPTPEPRLTVGDYAVQTNGSDSYRSVGQVVKIVEDDSSSIPWRTESLDGKFSGWAFASELRRATTAEIAAATKPAPARLQAGQYARVIANNGGHDVSNGTIVKIITDDETDLPYNALAVGAAPDDDHWFTVDDLEPLSPSESLLASVGRKVDEYKNGDIVRVTEDSSSRNRQGTVGVVGNVNGTSFTVTALNEAPVTPRQNGNFHRPYNVELVVPVESRVDLAVTA